MTGSDHFAAYPSLRDRVVFITGGATGIGAGLVEHFAAQGARVSFVDLDDSVGNRLADTIAATGAAAPRFQQCDVRDIAALQAAIETTGRDLGPVTVLINNAASDERHAFDTVTVEYWDDRQQVNLRPHFFAIQSVAPMMKRAGVGSIINFGSISWRAGFSGMAGYMTAKAAIEGLTHGMARELGPDGIRVNCLLPGWIMTERQLTKWLTPEAEATLMRAQALKEKLYPADVARMALWLAADDSRLCTGQNWIVDGGWI
jgi:NAD(P)-dependent dehydrogenase (short-subunit alcohol dehydrogenase family)